MARACALTLALCLLAVACSSAAADCLAQYAGCTNCVNVTLTAGNRRLLHNGGRGHGGGDRGLNQTSRDHQEGHSGGGDGGMHAADGSFTTCTECNTVGYVLVTETRGANTLGRCNCAAGWGVQLTNATTANLVAVHPRPGSFICVDCSLTGQVPLTNSSGVSLTYSNGTWSLVLGVTDAASWHSAWHLGRRRHGGAGVAPPPYYRGQCITCPDGSAPSTDSTACAATSGSSGTTDGSTTDGISTSPAP